MDVRKNIALKLKDPTPSGNGTAAKPSERKEKKAKRKKEPKKPPDTRGNFELESTVIVIVGAVYFARTL